MKVSATFALVYAVDGVVLPFLTVFLVQERGLSVGEIGWVLVTASVASLVASPMVSMLADGSGRGKALLIATLVVSAMTALIFGSAEGFWWLLVTYLLFSLTREPTSWPLLDGIFFASTRTIPAMVDVDYHRVRVWGTFGFMVPGLSLYFILDDGDSLGFLPLFAFGLCLAGIVVASLLPRTDVTVMGQTGPLPSRRLADTARSARNFLRVRSTALLLASMFLLSMSMMLYGFYYPLHATEVIGLAPRWLGLVTNIGVALELVYMTAFGWLVVRLGWRRLMIMGGIAAGLRVALIAVFPAAGVLMSVQVFHGMVIIVLYVGGRMILDRRAVDDIRYTTQGLYTMVVLGGGRIAGSAIGGWVATQSLSAVLWTAAVAAFLSALLIVWALPRNEDAVPSSAIETAVPAPVPHEG
jgi:PPP family 3-phenylpropionic acid transporter